MGLRPPTDYVRVTPNTHGQGTPTQAGLVQAPTQASEVQVIQQKLDTILAELKPITELFQSLAQNPMLKQFLT